MLDVEGFILVGGRSSRMGSDKSRLQFAGRTGIELIAGALSDLTSSVRLVGSRILHDGFENIPDLHQQWGALGGIHAALGACRSQWAAIVACDLPLVTAELFSRLGGFAEAGPWEAIVPIQPDLRAQPLCALYKRHLCLEVTEELIAAGEHTPRALLAAVKTRWVPFQELSDLAGAEHFFINVNTPADYERARLLISP
jgi:molybdenum cofactor guanylyltransferase